MSNRNRYLSGILLLLIGVLCGILFNMYQQNGAQSNLAEVKVTEVQQSSEPFFSDEQLEKLDDRFLFKNVAERIKPTVAYIETIVSVDRGDLPEEEMYQEEEGFWGNIMPRRARTVGSGIVISSDGYILTNNHVIDGAVEDEIELVLNDKRSFQASVVGQDPTTDLAVLKIDAQNLPAITIGNSDEVDVGEWVLAIGNPFRLRSTVTAGIVSALGRDVQIINEQMRVESFIQTDAAINKGNSGGALVNTSGELIGVNTAIASQSGSYQGYGFAVPSNLASKVARDLIEYGEIRRALLGVSIVSINASMAKELEMENIQGVLISDISPGGAADTHGLERNDVILTINGQEVNESNELQQKIAVLRPGDTVDLEVWRNKKIHDFSVELGSLNGSDQQLTFGSRYSEGEEPSPEEETPEQEMEMIALDLGIEVMIHPAPEDNSTRKLLIATVKEGSEADMKGLQEGYFINKVGGEKVEDLQTFKDLVTENLKTNHSVTFEVLTRDGSTQLIQLEE